MKDTQSPNWFSEDSFAFLTGLAQNNNRDWFTEHKARFQTTCEAPFANLLEALSNRLMDAPIPLEGSKKCMFRMNRDVRFSEDKSPYKTAVSGMLTRDGTKKEMNGIAYIHLDASGGFAACGWYKLQAKDLGPFRDRIVADPDGFSEVIEDLKAANLSLRTEDSLKSMPRGYAEHDGHPHADALKLKSFIVWQDLTKSAWISGDVTDQVEHLVRSSMPLLRYFSNR